jgi:hypothetical protein
MFLFCEKFFSALVEYMSDLSPPLGDLASSKTWKMKPGIVRVWWIQILMNR